MQYLGSVLHYLQGLTPALFYEHYAMKVGPKQLRVLLSILGKGEIVGRIFFYISWLTQVRPNFEPNTTSRLGQD